MSTDDQAPQGANTENAEDVAQGVTNQPPGNGDRDDAAIEAGTEKLEQAGGGH